MLDKSGILTKHFLSNGIRAKQAVPPSSPKDIVGHTLCKLADIRVSHTFSVYSYALSVALSLVLGYQLFNLGPLYTFLAPYVSQRCTPCITPGQTAVLWMIIFLEGVRHLYESYAYVKPSTSSMWIGNWFMELGFCAVIHFSLFVESMIAFRTYQRTAGELNLPFLMSWVQTSVVCAILSRMYKQNRLHHYLSTLPDAPNDRIPNKDEFALVISPHHGCEILIYSGLLVLGSLTPSGIFVNNTLLLALLFLYIKLRTTAQGSKIRYQDRFGEEAVKEKNLMFTPSLFSYQWK
jgi:hypothetical protein